MTFIPGSDGHPLSDAISVAGDRVFPVVQVADPAGNLVDPSAGTGGGSFPSSIEISNDSGNAIPVTASVTPRTPTTSSVSSSASSGVIINSNANRKGLSISNISTSKLYLSFSNPATIANSFIEVPSGAFLLFDQQLIVTNAIYGIWASANGTAQVTEYV